MVRPPTLSRMKQARELMRLGVDSSQVWTFMKVAAVACERQIFHVIGSAVLFGDDVLDVMRQFAVLLSQMAVFAAFVSTTMHELACCRIHLLLNHRIQAPPRLKFKDRDEIRGVDQRLIFGPLAVS